MSEKEFMTAWRTYAAAAVQALGGDQDRNHPPEVLCGQAATIADMIVKKEKMRLKYD